MNKTMRLGIVFLFLGLMFLLFGLHGHGGWFFIIGGFFGGMGASKLYHGNESRKIEWKKFWRKWGW